MGISHDLYKGLLVQRPAHCWRAQKLQVPQLKSPLNTHFERWSGKKRKLFFQDETGMITQGIRSFDLANNIFANLLASPMRFERNSKMKMPKDFMIQLKLRKNQNHGNSKCLQLVPVAEHSKLRANSYVINSKHVLQQSIKAAPKWIPTPALASSMRYFRTQDVEIDKEKFLSEYENKLESLIFEILNENYKPSKPPKEWDVIVRFDQENKNTIEICQQNSAERLTNNRSRVVLFNLVTLALLKEHSMKLEKKDIVLRFPENERLIKLLYKFLAYHTHQPLNHAMVTKMT
ncbi:RRG8 (YPR116W) [Zygosaccharomyces parabailii]|nr:RRG8 (YPR116W) [Zygosaccharomyces parabailii]